MSCNGGEICNYSNNTIQVKGEPDGFFCNDPVVEDISDDDCAVSGGPLKDADDFFDCDKWIMMGYNGEYGHGAFNHIHVSGYRDYEVHELPASANIIYIHDEGGSSCTGCTFNSSCPNCCGSDLMQDDPGILIEPVDLPESLPPWSPTDN